MKRGFEALWWTLDQTAYWIAFREPRLVDEAADDALPFSAILPERRVRDAAALPHAKAGREAEAAEDAEIFMSAAVPPVLDLPLRETRLPEDVALFLDEGHRTAVENDLRRQLRGEAGPATVRHLLDLLHTKLLDGEVVAGGLPGLEPHNWLSLRFRLKRGLSLMVRFDHGRISAGVFFRSSTVLTAFPAMSPVSEDASAVKQPGGRPRGASGYEESDLPVVRAMYSAPEASRVRTLSALARLFIDKAAGGATLSDEAKRKRLERRFRKEHPNHRLCRSKT